MSEALVKLVYSFHDSQLNYFLDNNSLIADDFIDQIKDFLLSNPRAPHLIQRDSPLSKEFYKLLGQNLNTIKRLGVPFKDLIFYQEKAGKVVQSFLVTSKLMELYVFFGTLIYLIVMYTVLQAF